MKLVLIVLFMSTMINLEPEIPVEVIMIVPQAAKDLVKNFEGLRLKAYKDIAGIDTVGYGHVALTPPPCTDCMIITEDQAENMLENDLNHVLSLIQGHIKADITDNQLAALISFAFNLGPNALINSTLLKDLNNGNTQAAADEFLNWDHSNGQVVTGLYRRRVAEQKLFLTPDNDGSIDVASN